MKVKSFLLGLCLLIIHLNIFGQQMQTYKGVFEGGIANYQYFTNDNFERIYNGRFQYDVSYRNKEQNISIIGFFKNNLKDSLWKYTVTSKISYFRENKAITTVKGKYKAGKCVGNWSLEIKDIVTKQIYEHSKANFKDGYLIGSYEYVNNIPVVRGGVSDISIKGELDNFGYCNGKWLINYNYNGSPMEGICTFQNGIQTFQILRNLSTGEVKHKLAYENNNLFIKNFDTLSKSSIVNNFAWVTITSQLFDSINNGTYINDRLVYPTDSNGDRIYINTLSSEDETILDEYINDAIWFWSDYSNGGSNEMVEFDNPKLTIQYGSAKINHAPIKEIVFKESIAKLKKTIKSPPSKISNTKVLYND